jgi:hypothetical protein
MSTVDAESKWEGESIRVFPFTGKDKKLWRAWSRKTLAVGKGKKWEKALTQDLNIEELQNKEEELSQDERKSLAMNDAAWNYLVWACQDRAFNIIDKVKDNVAFKAWQMLKKKYEPKEVDAYVQLQEEFQECKMESDKDDPTVFIEELEVINGYMGAIQDKYEKDDVEIISHIFSKLPASYSEFITSQKTKGIKNTSVEDIKDGLEEYWKRTIKTSTKTTATEEKALSVSDGKPKGKGGGRFKGTCNYCGKPGHKAIDCFKRKKEQGENGGNGNGSAKNNGKNKSEVTCFRCKKKGHKSYECPDKDPVTGLFVGGIEDPSEELGWKFTGIAAKYCELAENCVEKDFKSEDGISETVDEMKVETIFNGLTVSSENGAAADKDTYDEAMSVSARPNVTNNDNISLVDSGASGHTFKNAQGMYNIKSPIIKNVIVGNGVNCKIEKSGSISFQDSETKTIIEATEIHHVPNMTKNLLSLSRLIDDGWNPQFTKEALFLERVQNGQQKRIKCPRYSDGMYYLEAKRVNPQDVNIAETERGGQKVSETTWRDVTAEIDDKGNTKGQKHVKIKSMDINEAHDKLGHKGEVLLKKTLKHHSIKVTGELQSCEGCCLAKAKQKSVSKTTNIRAKSPGERLFVDMSGPFTATILGSRYQIQVVDDATRKGFIGFVKKRSDLSQWLEENVLSKLEGMQKQTKYLRADNAGENKNPLEKLCDKKGMTLELTAPDTPQQNGVVERRIAVLQQRANAMMMAADLTPEARALLWAEALNTANDLENISLNTMSDKSPDKLFSNELTKLMDRLVEFGRIGYATIRRKFKGKWKEKSLRVIMVGYAKNHSADTYRLYNPQNKSIIESRDVVWSDWKRPDPKRTLSIFVKDPDTLKEPVGIDDKEFVSEVKMPEIPQINIPEDAAPDTAAGRNVGDAAVPVVQESDEERAAKIASRLEREMRKLDVSWNPTAKEAMEKPTVVEQNNRSKQVHFVFNTELSSDHGEPKELLSEALVGPEKEKWLPSAVNEIMNFISRGSWKKVPRSQARKSGKTILPTKWVFKKKDEQDGTTRYKSRIVTKGFMQIPGVDYSESFSPVANDTSVRIGIAKTLANNDWVIEVIDIEAAFLEGQLDRDTYIEWPEGMVKLGFITADESERACIQLTKSMYGNVDAARRFYIEYKKHLTGVPMGMESSEVDPCVFYRKRGNKVCLVAMTHVDDTILFGPKQEIEWFKVGVKKRFNYSDLGKLKKHLGVWYEWKENNSEERHLIGSMPKLVKEIIESFERHVGREAKEYSTPGTPGISLLKNTSEIVDAEKYRSIVGKYMYLVTKIFPEGSNTARELTKHFSNPGFEHWKELERVVGYLKKYENDVKLIYRKPREMRAVANVDSKYATNKDDRRSVSGAFFTVGGTLTNWMSKTQASVALSSCEAEYVAVALATQELLFMQMLMTELGECEYPGIILEDNTGAIFLVKNQQVGQRTKHIDVRYHFIREHYENGEIDITHTRSENNEADIGTKNTTENLHQKHASNIRNGTMYVRENWNEMMKEIHVRSPEGGCREMTVSHVSVLRTDKGTNGRTSN